MNLSDIHLRSLLGSAISGIHHVYMRSRLPVNDCLVEDLRTTITVVAEADRLYRWSERQLQLALVILLFFYPVRDTDSVVLSRTPHTHLVQ